MRPAEATTIRLEVAPKQQQQQLRTVRGRGRMKETTMNHDQEWKSPEQDEKPVRQGVFFPFTRVAPLGWRESLPTGAKRVCAARAGDPQSFLGLCHASPIAAAVLGAAPPGPRHRPAPIGWHSGYLAGTATLGRVRMAAPAAPERLLAPCNTALGTPGGQWQRPRRRGSHQQPRRGCDPSTVAG
ncbi:hypothetical protein HDV57DRAFT_183052 [Trichoderma longibrachiatum]|uniref:Uncharacterized protein n=1 Tax=Trichoderma longibrachiatum ATCC 18648 TaxID=983965 RepID=A0A2T4BZE6_TRILO|nr:hypothetical protein M440DRAFT_101195 [Trichoderma longibrachiatum ATCC 18648]